MAESKTEKTVESKPKKGPNILLILGIGCLGLIVVLAIAGTIVSKLIFKNAGGLGTSLLQGAIEKQTGIKTDLKDLEQGKMTFTDTKTGSTVDIGGGKLPDTFPKDFPVYPGSKVTSAASGSEKGEGLGFWVTWSTPDSQDKVAAYYKTNLAAKGWETTGTYQTGENSTQTITKAPWSGTLAVTTVTEGTGTDIVIMLNEEKP